MSGIFYYVAFDNSWSVNLGQQAVRLAQMPGFTEIAELGGVGSSDVILDDPTGTAGHSSDGIIALQQFFYDDTRAAIKRVYAGWTGQRQYTRGDTARPSLRTGAARQIHVHLEDPNTLAGRLHFAPATVDATVKRPAESASARISWLLSTAYLPGVGDRGLVQAALANLDPNDYSDQTPADLLNHCCVATGDNWFIYWDRTANAYGLAVFNMTTYNGYVGTLQLSNDLSIIDSNLDGKWTAGATDTWAIQPDALLTRDPSHYCDRVSLPYAKGTVYVTTTSTKFPDVTHSAPSTSIKTSALATAQANRFLADNAEETDRITVSAKIGAAHVNDALAGQLIKASFTHFPTYTSLSNFRIARRTVSQVEPTDQFYSVQYELVPVTPQTPVASYAEVIQPSNTSGGPDNATSGATLAYQGDGDTWVGGTAKYGKIAYDNSATYGSYPWSGLKFLGGGTVTVRCVTTWLFVIATDCTMTMDILLNGSVVATGSLTRGSSSLGFWGNGLDVSGSGITVANGDVLTARLTWSQPFIPGNGAIPGADPGSALHFLSAQGNLL